jgi:hypothetical protein
MRLCVENESVFKYVLGKLAGSCGAKVVGIDSETN